MTRFNSCETGHGYVLFPDDESCPMCCAYDQVRSSLKNSEFFRQQLHAIGDLFGEDARFATDGTLMDEVLVLNVYPLVKQAVNDNNRLRRITRRVRRVVVGRKNPHGSRRSGDSPAFAMGLIGGFIGFVAGRLKGRTE